MKYTFQEMSKMQVPSALVWLLVFSFGWGVMSLTLQQTSMSGMQNSAQAAAVSQAITSSTPIIAPVDLANLLIATGVISTDKSAEALDMAKAPEAAWSPAELVEAYIKVGVVSSDKAAAARHAVSGETITASATSTAIKAELTSVKTSLKKSGANEVSLIGDWTVKITNLDKKSFYFSNDAKLFQIEVLLLENHQKELLHHPKHVMIFLLLQ